MRILMETIVRRRVGMPAARTARRSVKGGSMEEIAYVNGRFCGLDEATVSVEDRGFQFGDGVYEVLVAPRGRPFWLQQHLDRLKRSTDAIDLPIDYKALNLPGVIEKGIRRCGFEDVMVYLQITRGRAPRDHLYSSGITPTVIATFKPRPVFDPEMRTRGVALETARDIRWARCSVKSTALLPNVLLKNAATRRGFFDAVTVGADDVVRETSNANVFIVTGGLLRTPPATERILHGVTRAYLLECADRLGIPCAEVDFTAGEMRAADEVFICSTTMDVMPVTSVDGKTIGKGKPGETTMRLLTCFRDDLAAGI